MLIILLLCTANTVQCVPWTALVSQLAYQTGGSWNNLKSGLISIGSPIWTGYCLLLSLCYQVHIGRRCRKMNPAKDKQIEHVRRIAQSFIFAPIRISIGPQELSELVTNERWLEAVAERLEATELQTGVQFHFPVLVASGVYILTLVTAFKLDPSPVGVRASGSSLEWQISIGTLWLWMVCIVLSVSRLDVGWAVVVADAGTYLRVSN